MKKKIIAGILVTAVAMGAAGITSYQSSKADNPIVQNIYTADPAPMVHGDTMYLITSHDEDVIEKDFYTMNDWKCFSSKDMVNWTDHGTIMSKDSFSWAEDRAWAPQTVARNGKFYLYVPLHKKSGGMVIGVGVSDKPEGPYVDAIGAPLVENAGSWNDIDPTVFIDDDGQAYLYFGNPRLRCVKLNEDMISYDKEFGKKGLKVFDMSAEEFGTIENTGSNPDNRKSTYGEGPWFYKRNGIYYMVYAAFEKTSGCSEHLAYSTSDSPMGPWKYGGQIMPSQGGCYTNHPGVTDFMGHSYLFYHNQALEGGGSYHRSVGVEEFTYNADGSFPIVNMTKLGPSAIKPLVPYEKVEAETIAFSKNIEMETLSTGERVVTDIKNGSYLKIRDVDFGKISPTGFNANMIGIKNGTMELHIDSIDGAKIGTVTISNTSDKIEKFDATISEVTGKHDLFMVFKADEDGEVAKFDSWIFEGTYEQTPEVIPTAAPTPLPSPTVTPDGGDKKNDKPSDVIIVKTPSKVKGVKVKRKKASALISWKKVSGAKGYKLQVKCGKKVTNYSTKKTKYLVKKLKKNKKYTAKVAAYNAAGGKTKYGKFSKVVTFKCK